MKQLEVGIDLRGEFIPAGILVGRGSGQGERATFTYYASYLAHPETYALDPMLPLRMGAFDTPLGRTMFGAFMDAAPDQWGRRIIMNASERDLTYEPLSEIDFVTGVRDDMRQGNLRIRNPDTNEFLTSTEKAFPPVLKLAELLAAAEAFDANNSSNSALEELLAAGSSIGGARPKAVVVDEDGNLHIAKFPRASVDQWDVNAWERVANELAHRSGIEIAPSQLLQVDGSHVLLVRRFDRKDGHRIGYVSAMTMLEANIGDPASYVEIAEVITEHGLHVTRDLRELWRRIAFSIAISNTDDHLRNHGFLRSSPENGWNLSPAFDINPEPRSKHPHLSTPIRPGAHDADIKLLLEESQAFRISPNEARQVITEVNNAVAQWRLVADSFGISPPEQNQMSNAFRPLIE